LSCAFAPIRQCKQPQKLHGLSNVNDYFNSFNNNNDSNKQPNNDEPGQGSSYASANDYFNSFNKPKSTDSDRTDKWHGNDNFGLNNYDTEHQKDQLKENFSPQNNKPTQQMTLAEIEAYNNARLDPKMLLTQTAIQSFCVLLEECRDPHSGKWIEDFLEVKGLMNYHGNGAFNITKYPTWDSLLIDLMRQPNGM
jgi:hypothetical protein